MTAVLHPPGDVRDHFRPASSGSIMNGSYPAAYEDSLLQGSGNFRPPTSSPAPTMPALQSHGGYGSLERPGSYEAGTLPIGSQGKIGSYGSRHESGGYGSLEIPGSYDARNSPMASSPMLPGSHGSRDRHGTGYTEPQTEYDAHGIRSYPSGNLPSSGVHLPDHAPISSSNFHKPGSHGSDKTMHAGIPDTVHGLHAGHGHSGYSPPTATTQPYGYGSPHASPPGTVHGLHSQETLHGLHSMNSRPTVPNLHSYPGAPGSQQSLQSQGTVHDLHPAYKPGMGYSPPASQQFGQMQHSDDQFSGKVMGKLRVRVIAAYNLKNTDLGVVPGEVSDPFCVIRLGKQEHTTDVVRNNLNPVFHSPNFEFDVDDEDAHVKIEIFNASQFYAHDSLGKVHISITDLVPCEVHPRREAFHDGQGEVEVELTYIPPERRMESLNHGSMTRQGGFGFPGVAAMPQMVGEHKKVQHKVPLPNWHNCGPEAFAAPPPEMEHARVGEERRNMEYDTWACHLGQYDYQKGGPVYFPRARPTDEDDRHKWKEDPFHDWRNDHDNMEVGGKMSGAIMKHQTRENKDAFHRWIKDKPAKPDQHRWKNDPFDGWLRSDKKHSPEHGNEKMQEAKMKRHKMHLPSFSEMNPKQFDDHREYCNLQDHVAPRSRVGEQLMLVDKEHSWKNDAFYGWLPGRGHDHHKHEMLMDHQPELHRPLEAARMKRLPSFSDDKFLGLRGKGLGVLKVNVMKAEHLEYDAKEYQGRPSACVKLAMLLGKDQDGKPLKHQQKCTATIERNANPVYNTGFFQFEIPSQSAEFRLRVVDILVEPTAFLGEVVIPVAKLMQSETPIRYDPDLVGHLSHKRSRHGSSKIFFEACYLPYAGGRDRQPMGSMHMKSIEGHDHHHHHDHHKHKSHSHHSHHSHHSRPESSHGLSHQHRSHSHASSAGTEGIALATVRLIVIKATNLENKAMMGILDGVSDPYVKVTLIEGGKKKKPQKTKTIDNDLNPVWQQKFEFDITDPEWHRSKFMFEVFSERSLVQKATETTDPPLGHCEFDLAYLDKIPGHDQQVDLPLEGTKNDAVLTVCFFRPDGL